MNRYFDTDHLEANLKTRALRGGAVTIATQAASFALTLASTAILARLLSPGDYGLIAMVTVVVGFMAIFNDFGLSMATIQRSEITQPQVSTLFWLNSVLGLLLMLLTAAFAPGLAWFYDDRRLVSLTIFLAVTFLISGLGVQHQALLRRQMRYVSLASIEITALIVGIVLAVAAALRGTHYWALAIQMVATAAVRTVGVWLLCGWRPGPPSRRAGIASMLAFGGNLAGFNVINYLARNFDQVLIGRVWGGGELGSYERASRLLQMPIKLLSTPISHVAIPVLCRLQNDPKRYREYYLKALYSLAFVLMPGMAFITVMASDLVAVLMGDQWGRAGVIFSVLGVMGLLFPVSNTLGWHYIASGTTNRLFRWGLFDGAVVVSAVAIGVSRGALGVAVAFTAARVVLFLPGIWYATRTVPVDVSDILRTIRIPLLGSMAMGASLYFIERVFLEALPVWHRLLIAFPSAAIAYLAISCLATWSLSPLFDLPRLAVAVFKARNAADSDPGSSE